MRVLLVIEAAGGGVARHVLDLAGGLIASGVEVGIAYSPDRADAAFLAALQSMSRLSGVHQVDMRRAPGPRDFFAWRHLRRIIRTNGPFDIVHGHSTKAGALVRLAAPGSGVATVYTPHAFITMNPAQGRLTHAVYGFVERLLSRMGDRIICVSDDERAHAIELGIAASQLSVIYNGIQPLPAAERAAVRASMQLGAEDVCIGFVGRLSQQKAVDRLVAAFAPVAAIAANARLVIVGDGPDLVRVREQVKSLGIADHVRCMGAMDGVRMMAGFDVFALASRYEGFPYVFPEAAARGLPIVSYDVGGVSAAVEEGVNGYIVAQGDAATLGKHLLQLVQDKAERIRLGKNSERIADRFSVAGMVRETLDVYHALAQTDARTQ